MLLLVNDWINLFIEVKEMYKGLERFVKDFTNVCKCDYVKPIYVNDGCFIRWSGLMK